MVLFFEAISEMGNACFPKPKARGKNSVADRTSKLTLNDEDSVEVKYVSGNPSEERVNKASTRVTIGRDEKIAAIQADNLKKLRLDYKKNREMFILNNLLLAVEFFENYDKNKEDIKTRQEIEEKKVSSALGKSKNSCVFEGARNEFIGQNISYFPKGENQGKVIGKLRYILLQDQMEVYPESSEHSIMSEAYSRVDGNMRFIMEKDDMSPGFCLLRCVDRQRKPETKKESPYNAMSIDESELYSKMSDYDEETRRPTDASDESKKDSGYQEQIAGENEEGEEEGEKPSDPLLTPTRKLTPGLQLMEELDGVMLSSEKKPKIMRPKSLPFYVDGGVEGPTGPIRKYSKNPAKSLPSYDYEEKPVEKRSRPNSANMVLVRRGSTFSMAPVTESMQRTKTAIAEDSETIPTQKRMSHRHKSLANRQSCDSLASSSDESIYARIDDVRRPLPSRRSFSRNVCPDQCIKDIPMLVKDEDGDDPNNPLNLEINSVFQNRQYLSSSMFLSEFSSSVIHTYAEYLKFENLLMSAHVNPPSVYVHESPDEGNSKIYVYVPSLSIPWPDMCIEWYMRKRMKVRDTRTGIVYQWPPQTTIDAIRQQGCYLLPRGDSIRGNSTAHSDLQWEISFSKAEAALLSTLTHVQMRCLYWAFLLYEDQLAEFPGVDTRHIITIMFYLLETNYGDWSEVSMGDRLCYIFSQLSDRLRRKKLPHYFYSRRNLLRSRHDQDIRRVQERILRVFENIIPTVLNIGKRLESKSFPLPDFDKLRQILNNDSATLLGKINPALLSQAPPDEPVNKKKSSRAKSKISKEDDGFWGDGNKENLKKKDPTRQFLQENYKRLEQEKKAKASQVKQFAEVPEEAYTYKNQPFERAQAQLLLEYFIDHFLDLARKAETFKSYKEVNQLLDHCDNLVALLRDEGFGADTEDFIEEIERIRQLSQKKQQEQRTVAGLDFVKIKSRGKNWELKKSVPLPEIPSGEKKIARAIIGLSLQSIPLIRAVDEPIISVPSNSEPPPPETGIARAIIGMSLQSIPVVRVTDEPITPAQPHSETDFTKMWVEAQVHPRSDSEEEYSYSGAAKSDTGSVIYDRLENMKPFIFIDNAEEEESTDL